MAVVKKILCSRHEPRARAFARDHTRQREVARAPTFARMTSLKVSRAGQNELIDGTVCSFNATTNPG